MRQISLPLLMTAALSVTACGGPGASAGDPAKIEVPPQPPQPPAPPPPKPPAPIAVRPFECKGGHVFRTATRSYCAHSDGLGWDDAEARCVSEGGHLVAFETEAASNEIHAMLGSPIGATRAMWIGLEASKRPAGSWKWATGEQVTASSWAPGEPNNYGRVEACGEWLAATGTWNDTRCELAQPVLCESIPNSKLKCPSGKVVSGEGLDYCYLPYEASYADAKKGCTRIGGTIAMPKTAGQNDALRRAVAQRFAPETMWIGLSDLAEHGTWMWSTGAPLGFDAWKAREPNRYEDNEHCTELFADTWEWNDFDCAQKLASVCQGPIAAPRDHAK